MKRMVVTLLMVAVFSSSSSQASSSETYKSLQQFLDSNFPKQAFMATPIGAGDRFAPPSIWIYLKHAQGTPGFWSNGKADAWLPFSDGVSLYSKEFLPLHVERVDLFQQNRTHSYDWALTASLAGSIEGIDIDETVKLARAKGLDVQITTADAEIVYGYYGDFLVAQEVNQAVLDRMNKALQARFNNKVPQRRVVTAALRVRKSSVAIKKTGSVNFDSEADLTEKLGKLGFKWNSATKEFQTLSIGDEWRYIAFQSLLTDQGGKISTSPDTPAPDDFAFVAEVPWRVPLDGEIP